MRAPYVDATMRAWLIGVVGTLPQEISPQRVDASREDVLVKCERDGNLEDSPDPENAEDASFARENKALLDGPKPVSCSFGVGSASCIWAFQVRRKSSQLRAGERSSGGLFR